MLIFTAHSDSSACSRRLPSELERDIWVADALVSVLVLAHFRVAPMPKQVSVAVVTRISVHCGCVSATLLSWGAMRGSSSPHGG